MDEESELDTFCGSKFWDTNVTWATDTPDLTPCFQRTCLVWLPCAFLWVFSSLEVFYLINSKYRNVPWNALNLSKIGIVVLLSVLTLVDFGYAVNLANTEDVFNVQYYTPFILLATFCLCGVFLVYNKIRGMTASGLLFLFWFLLALCGAVQFRSEIMRALDIDSYTSNYFFISYMVYYPLVLIQFFLHCFADKPPIFNEFPPVKNPCPELRSSSLSRLFFGWFDKMAWLGFRKPLEPSDLWSMNPEDTSAGIVPQFEKYWSQSVDRSAKKTLAATASFEKRSSSVDIAGKTQKKNGASILWPLCKAFGPTFLFGSVLKLTNDLLTFVSPHILELLIGFIQGDDSEWKGYLYATLLVVVAATQTIVLSQYFYRMMQVGLRSRTALISSIYRKALRMSNSARKESTVGEIVNLMAVDAQRFMDLTTYLNMIWSAPLQIALALYFLWNLLGPSVLAGLAVMIILIPINGFIANKTKTLQIKQMKNKDERVKVMNEVLSGIKVLKLYAWEPSFEEQILKIRGKEISVLKQAAYLNAGTSFIWSCAPFLVSVVTLGTYVLVDPEHEVDATIAFVSLNYFNLMRFPMSMLPMLISFMVQVCLVTLAAYVLLGNDLTPIKAFVSLSYFHLLRFPMMGLPMLISGLIQVALVSFATFVLSDEKNVLDSRKAFVGLSLFNILRFPLSMLPMMISSMIQASVSVNRINKFLNSDELDPNNVTHDENEQLPLLIENGTFSWGPDEKPTLQDINLHVRQGQLVAVVGTVGSGKSSLISALLGEMEKFSGRVNTKGSVAYVPQQAWIQNATLRDNILFGKSLEQTRYARVVDACALKPDLEMLPGGDQTEIGEKGINLSGGQKQRVSLARAVYNHADIYFLDDPLSAVDSHVGKHIFENVIGPSGILRKKTRILVTHGITYLPEVDVIVVLKDGVITETGTYKELLERKGAFAEFLIAHLQESEDVSELDLEEMKTQLEGAIGEETFRELQRQRSETKSDSGSLGRRTSVSSNAAGDSADSGRKHSGAAQSNGTAKPKEKDKLIEIEKAETGSVKWHVYSHYLRSIGIWMSVGTLVMNMVYQGFSIGSNMWLSAWSDATTAAENGTLSASDRDMYLGVYGALGLGQGISNLIGSLTTAEGCIAASIVLHNDILRRAMRGPMYLFDTTPIGRIVNRFSKDVDTVDNVLPQNLRGSLGQVFSVIATIFVISYTTPIFVAVIIPIGVLYYFIQRFYVATSRQLKRIESVSRSPIYSHFGESVTGAQTIRAYTIQNRFIHESEDKVDFNQVCYYPSMIANRWLAVRLEMIGNLIIFFAALFAVLNRETMNPGLVGLSVTYSLQITQTLNWLVRMTSDVETNIVAVERIKEYGETPQEAPWDIPESKPPATWPSKGEVEFKNYQVRYREGLDLVLKGVDFHVRGGEKVGIVGRTGAGKSSLTLALFRIIEPANGTILIDGLDVTKMGLHDLRNRLTIIPQDPVLFSGTIRLNLDPFKTYSDQEVWQSLEHAHLKSFVSSLTLGLDHEVSEGGENLSVGQRQLICLARALLRKTKVLVLDEATAAVDLETDDLIQTTIRSEFKDCTVLTIAHRLNTILDSDRVIVLDKGLIVEFDSPQTLLSKPKSIFAGMAKDAGITAEKKKA